MRELKMHSISEWALHRYYNTGTRSMMLAGAGEIDGLSLQVIVDSV